MAEPHLLASTLVALLDLNLLFTLSHFAAGFDRMFNNATVPDGCVCEITEDDLRWVMPQIQRYTDALRGKYRNIIHAHASSG